MSASITETGTLLRLQTQIVNEQKYNWTKSYRKLAIVAEKQVSYKLRKQ
jgi:hypothetical protein